MLRFEKFPVAKKFMDKRGGSIKISFKTFLSHSSKNAVGEPFSLLLVSGIRKIWMRG